jgi:hypothetical protein
MHYVGVVAALPTLSPLDAKTIVGAIEVGPEAEVERRDEEDPIQCRACTGMGRIVGFWWAEMERIGMPCAWGIAVFDQTISYLQFDMEYEGSVRVRVRTKSLHIAPLLLRRHR